ncbi:zinc finger protein 532 [Ixodes scapularis]
MWRPRSNVNCCVTGCKSTYRTVSDSGQRLRFFSFPAKAYHAKRRNDWIELVRRARGDTDGTWSPTKNSRICSKHFVGHEKGEDPREVNYNPTIFEPISKEQALHQKLYAFYTKGGSKNAAAGSTRKRPSKKASKDTKNSATETTVKKMLSSVARTTATTAVTQPPQKTVCKPASVDGDLGTVTLDDFLREWSTDPFPKFVAPRLAGNGKGGGGESKEAADRKGFECPVCGDKYGCSRSLRRHLSRRSFLARLPCCKCRSCHLAFNRCTLIMRAQGCHIRASGATLSALGPGETLVPVELSQDGGGTPGVAQDDVPMTVLEKVLQNVVCSECFVELRDASAREDHFHPSRGNLLRCASCPMLCTSECALRAHRRLHLQRRPFVCPECGLRTEEPWAAFHRHVCLHCHHFDRIVGYHCQLCPALLLDQNELAAHIVDTHSSALHKCQACPMAFVSLDNFHQHRKSVHPKLRSTCWLILKCPLCEAVFASSELLTSHVGNHLERCGRSLFKCTACDSLQPTRADLIAHLEKLHPGLHEPSSLVAEERGFAVAVVASSEGVVGAPYSAGVKKEEVIELDDDDDGEDQDREEVIDEEAVRLAREAKRQAVTKTYSPKKKARSNSQNSSQNSTSAEEQLQPEAGHTKNAAPNNNNNNARTCAKCAFESDDPAVFRKHIATHRPANHETFQCPECGLCYVVEPSLRKHLRGVHRIVENAAEDASSTAVAGNNAGGACAGHRCSVCLATFDTERELKSHTRTHGMAFLKKVKASGNA